MPVAMTMIAFPDPCCYGFAIIILIERNGLSVPPGSGTGVGVQFADVHILPGDDYPLMYARNAWIRSIA